VYKKLVIPIHGEGLKGVNKMTKVSLGINNVFAIKRWPEPHVWAHIVRSTLNLESVQLNLDLIDPLVEEPALSKISSDIADAIRENGLTINTAFTGYKAYASNMLMYPDPVLRQEAIHWYEKAIVAVSKLNISGIGGHFAAYSVNDYASRERREYLRKVFIESIRYLSEVARISGLNQLILEPMGVFRELSLSIEQTLELYEEINTQNKGVPVKLCIDVGHQFIYKNKKDADPYMWLKKLAHLSPVVHIQQTDGKADRHWPFTPEFNKIGIINPQKVLEAINKSGAKEVELVFEIVHPPATEEKKVLEELRESVEYWRIFLS